MGEILHLKSLQSRLVSLEMTKRNEQLLNYDVNISQLG